MKSSPGLLELLAKNRQNPLAEQLLHEFPNGIDFEASHPVSLREVKDIYRFRARRNENMGKSILGFPVLIAGLDAFSGDAVVVYSVHSDAGPYKIFADEDCMEIAGILKFPAELVGKPLPVLSELQAA